jgi:hypothetical protein
MVGQHRFGEVVISPIYDVGLLFWVPVCSQLFSIFVGVFKPVADASFRIY